jgi:uncharacterized protein DUF6448
MMKVKLLAATVLSAALLLGAQTGAQAHCDSVDGPVAKAAVAALDTKNVNLALPFAPAAAEPEIKAAFTQALRARALGADAKTLADRAFVETTVRLHRAGEGAPYTGLKAAGVDYGPAIPAAERAVASGDLRQVKAVLAEEMEHSLTHRFEAIKNTAAHTAEPKTADQVPAARERISAELGFVTYVEGVRQAMHGATAGHEHK